MKEQKICPECGKPVEGLDHPEATVYHMKCLMDKFAHIRARMQEKQRGQSDKMGKAPSR